MSFSQTIMSVHLMGGLCNQIFQIASAYAISLKYNKKLIVSSSWHNPHSSINYFTNIFRKIEYNTSIKVSYRYNEPSNGALLYCDIPNIDDMQMFGYFQNEKYFISYREQVLDLFSIEPDRKEKLIQKYKDVDNCYFIHIRRGDYVNNKMHDIDLNEYYKRCINYIQSVDTDIKFYIFSNDINYCKQLYWLQNINVEYICDIDEVDSLYLMSMCRKGGIGCNSSYSWWGGYLNNSINKLVIYPNKWFNNEWTVDIGWSGCKIFSV